MFFATIDYQLPGTMRDEANAAPRRSTSTKEIVISVRDLWCSSAGTGSWTGSISTCSGEVLASLADPARENRC